MANDRPYNNSELFLDHFLDTEVPKRREWDCDDDAIDTYDALHELYENEYEDGYAENYDNEDDNLSKWIEEVLDHLGYDYLVETGLPGTTGDVDRVLFPSETARKESVMPRASNDYDTVYDNATTILEAKQWDADFDQKFSEDRNYFNAGNQIKYYLSHLPPSSINWGILTNGRHWRLYGTDDYQTYIFYEIDLIEAIESDNLEDFKYFYCFFRPDAFVTGADGQCFLDDVYEESANAARNIGSDLHDNVFRSLTTLGEGFIATNDLEIQDDGHIDPDSLNIDLPNDEPFTLQDLKEQSLVFLYRLMFAFYAESRDLLQPDTAKNQLTYHVELSLLKLRDEIIECGDTPDAAANTYLSDSATQWTRLDTFFHIIDQGKSSIGMTAYDGGLFDRSEHKFLNEHSVSNQYLAKVIYLLSTTKQNSEYKKVDYSGLGTRHLGSIYEGLLEHQFEVADEQRIAVEEDDSEEWKSASDVLPDDTNDDDGDVKSGDSDTDTEDEESLADRVAAAGVDAVDWVEDGDLYVVNDRGERKSTGSFYTPNYVVEYLVEKTVDPLIKDIHDALDSEDYDRGSPEYAREFRNRVLDLTVVDPAMGSGHFLTEATTYLAQQVVEAVREADELVIEEAEGFGTAETRTDGGSTVETESGENPGADATTNGNGASKFQENQIRRDIAKECIYGVDVNPMAVELAKLSMWLETLAADQPLAFLDHHLRTGNSLIGADIEAVDGINAGEDLDGEQTGLSRYQERRQNIIDDIMDLFGDLLEIPNDSLTDAREMKRIYYEDIEQNPKYRRLKQIANVHTAERIDLDWARESAFAHSGLPGNAYEYMAEVLDDDELWDGDPDENNVTAVTERSWFKAAQSLADEEEFFHWKVEFPEVFFDEDGEKLPDAGFDVMLGNPPYIPTEEISDRQKTYLTTRFSDILHRKYDLSVPFLQQCYDHTHDSGYVGMITPVSWETGSNYEPFRSENFGNDGDVGIQQVINLPFDVFPDAYVDTTICIFTPSEVPDEFAVKEFPKRHQIQDASEIGENLEFIDYQQILDDPATKIYVLGSIYDLMAKYGSDDYDTIGDVTNSTQGPVESHYDYSQTRKADSQLLYRDLDVYRYSLSVTDERYICMDTDDSNRDYYTTPRVLIRRLVSRDDRLMAMYETDDYVVKKDLNPFLRDGATESLQYLLANLNSALHSYLYINRSSLALKDDFRQTTLTDLRELPYRSLSIDADADHDPNLPSDVEDTIEVAVTGESKSADDELLTEVEKNLDDDDGFVHDVTVTLVEHIIDTKALHSEINTNMLSYFGEDLQNETLTPEDYTRLADLTEYQPPSSKSDLLTTKTGGEYETLEITSGSVEKDGLKLKLVVDIRSREESDDEYDIHEGITVATFLDPDDDMKQLLRAFLPEVIDRAEGYADFRNYATGSRSTLENRVKNIRLPDTSDVSDDVDRFLDRKEESAQLAEKILRCDDLIDRIVYQLYDLSDKQITQVEERLKSDS